MPFYATLTWEKTFVFTDAHITGLGATQGDTIKDAKPVAFASRSTQGAETRYPQLEALGLYFDLRCFRNYLVGSPKINTVVTDHKPFWKSRRIDKNRKDKDETTRR